MYYGIWVHLDVWLSYVCILKSVCRHGAGPLRNPAGACCMDSNWLKERAKVMSCAALCYVLGPTMQHNLIFSINILPCVGSLGCYVLYIVCLHNIMTTFLFSPSLSLSLCLSLSVSLSLSPLPPQANSSSHGNSTMVWNSSFPTQPSSKTINPGTDEFLEGPINFTWFQICGIFSLRLSLSYTLFLGHIPFQCVAIAMFEWIIYMYKRWKKPLCAHYFQEYRN